MVTENDDGGMERGSEWEEKTDSWREDWSQWVRVSDRRSVRPSSVAHLSPFPGDLDPTETPVCVRERIERRRREIQVGHFARAAAVDDGDNDRFIPTTSFDLLAADRVVVGVHAVVSRVGVEQEVGDSNNGVRVRAHVAARAKTSVIEGTLAVLRPSEESARGRASSTGGGGGRSGLARRRCRGGFGGGGGRLILDC